MTERRKLSIDVFSDVVCPWCFIGARRLAQALEGFADVDAEVRYHPFELQPGAPEEGLDLHAHLREQYGRDPASMFAPAEAAAKETGLDLDLAKVRLMYPTLAAHTLLRHAAEKGTQRGLAEALFAAYFLEQKNIAAKDTLVPLAVAHGFTEEEATRLLDDEGERAWTRRRAQLASAEGIRGVPFFVFADRFAFSGAQPREVFEAAIRRALDEGEDSNAVEEEANACAVGGDDPSC